MSDILHNFDNARANLRETSSCLMDLPEAFERTGNLPVASELRILAANIAEAEAICNQSMSQMVNERFQAAREASDNLLLTALAVFPAFREHATDAEVR